MLKLKAIPPQYQHWLTVAWELSQARGSELFVVGGFVRDFFLGFKSEDLDLMVTENAIGLAEALQRELGGHLKTHPAYHTATIEFDNREKLDLVTARREAYPSPGAKPVVNPGTLETELERRDFTVNSMAIRLSSPLEGELVDLKRGRQDLEEKVLRVHHPSSFIDDPSRILRALRFSQRLGFAIEPDTLRWLNEAVTSGAFERAQQSRVGEEFLLCLKEESWQRTLERLSQMGILKAIHPAFQTEPGREKRLQQLGKLDLTPGFRARMSLYILGEELPESARESLNDRFAWAIPSWDAQMIESLELLCDPELAFSAQAEHLDKLSEEDRVRLLCRGNSSLRELFARYRSPSSQAALIGGDDLLALGLKPGPQIGRWKRESLRAQRDKVFSDREGALNWLAEELVLRQP